MSPDQKQQAQLLEQQQKAERERQLEVLLADERSSYVQNLQALEAKMQAEAASAQRELDRALEVKLQERSELLQSGFNELAALQREINNKQQAGAGDQGRQRRARRLRPRQGAKAGQVTRYSCVGDCSP